MTRAGLALEISFHANNAVRWVPETTLGGIQKGFLEAGQGAGTIDVILATHLDGSKYCERLSRAPACADTAGRRIVEAKRHWLKEGKNIVWSLASRKSLERMELSSWFDVWEKRKQTWAFDPPTIYISR